MKDRQKSVALIVFACATALVAGAWLHPRSSFSAGIDADRTTNPDPRGGRLGQALTETVLTLGRFEQRPTRARSE